MKHSNITVYKLSSDYTQITPLSNKRKILIDNSPPNKKIRKKRVIYDSDDSDDSESFSHLSKYMGNRNNNDVSEDNALWNSFHFDSKDIREFNLLKNSSIRISGDNLDTPNNRRYWTSATSLKNYMLNDTVLDWLQMYYDSNMVTLYSTFFNNTDNKKVRKSGRLCNNSVNKMSDDVKNDIIKKMTTLKNSVTHFNKLFENGNVFEEKILDEFKRRASIVCEKYEGDHRFVKVFSGEDYEEYKRTKSTNIYKKRQDETLEYMKKGVPVIAQAALLNANNHTFGVADLLIRSDYIQIFFENPEDDDRLNVGAPVLGVDYHYRVCDIKWSKFQCNADGVTLRNNGFVPAYKAQLAVYNVALGKLQGYIPPKAYILCKAWHVESSTYNAKSNDSFDKLCEIDYENNSKFGDSQYIKRTKDAIKWVQRVSLIGHTWRFGSDSPDIPELYPNMCNENCGQWRGIKKIIADYYEELTRVWYVGTKHRQVAHNKGIYRTLDVKCNCSNLGIAGANKNIIDKILEVNRSKTDLILPVALRKSEYSEWLNPRYTDYYVDFETFNGVIKMKPNEIDIRNAGADNDITFMVGIGFDELEGVDTDDIISTIRCSTDDDDRCGFTVVNTSGWEYVCFYMKSACMEQEKSVYEHFMIFFAERKNRICKVYKDSDNKLNRLFHWTDAEKRYLKTLNQRHYDRLSENKADIDMIKLIDRFNATCKMVDLFVLFRKVPIVIKGSFNFKLKSVTNAMRKNGLITTAWPDSSVMEGFSATLIAAEIYNNIDDKKINQDDLGNTGIYKDIINYNEIDCKSMRDIRKYLLKNAIP